MDGRRSGGGAERFSAYLDELASVIGRVSRVGPMRDYCTGLLLPGERKSVEPIAAYGAGRVAAQHQSLLHFVAKAAGRTRACWPRCARWCCRRSSGMAPLRPGSSTTPAFPSMASIRSACRISTAARRQAGQLSGRSVDCRSPTITRACRWRIGCIFPRAGRRKQAAPREGRRARRDRVQDQAGDRTRPDRMGVRGGPPAWCRADGRGLRHGCVPARERDGTWGSSMPFAIRARTLIAAGKNETSVEALALDLPKLRGRRSRGGRARPRCSNRALPACA